MQRRAHPSGSGPKCKNYRPVVKLIKEPQILNARSHQAVLRLSHLSRNETSAKTLSIKTEKRGKVMNDDIQL